MCFLQCSQHLFLTCVTYPIRLGFSVTFPSQGPSHYLCHCRLIHGKNAKKIWMVLWHSVVWNLWLLRNSIIFSNGNYDFIYLLDLVWMHSWLWFLDKTRVKSVSFSSWCGCPIESIRAIS